MADLRKTFVSGRMETDLDNRLIQDGLYQYAENVIVLDSEGSDTGAVQNSLSNIKLTNINLGPNPITLGTYANEMTGKLYWAVKSDTGCFILEYDPANNVSVKVLEDTRAKPNRVLDFNEKNLITAIDIVGNDDPSKNLMIINDDNLQPLCFNIERAKNYGLNGFSKEDIFLIKKPPRFAPKIQPTFVNGASNYIEEQFLTFTYAYKYLDGEYSALSSYTNYVFYPKAFELDYEVNDNIGMVNSYNAVRITINTGDKRVTDIQCVIKSSNSNNLYIIETFNKENEGWGHNETRSFVFSNNKIYINLPESEIYRASDNVPYKAKSQTVIGNILVMGNFLEGFDLTDKLGNNIKPTYNLSIISTSLEGNPVPYTLGNSAGFTGNLLNINFTGLSLVEGGKINLFISLKNSQTNPTSYNQSFPFILNKNYVNAAELAQDVDFVFFIQNYITNLFLANYTINPIANSEFESNTTFTINSYSTNNIVIKSPELLFRIGGVTPQIIKWAYQSASSVLYYKIGSNASLKTNRSVEIGLIYIEEFNRATTVQTQLNNTIFIPHELADSRNRIKINLSSTPPVAADRYKIVVKTAKLEYHTIYATTFYIDGLYRWVKLESDNKDKVKVGENLIFKSDTNGVVPFLTKVKVLEIKDQPADFIIGNQDLNAALIKEVTGLYMKIKIPAGISMNYVPDGFIERNGGVSSVGDYFDMAIGPFTNIVSGVFVDIPIKQGSKIDLGFANAKGIEPPITFFKTYFASTNYANFKLWYDAEVNNNTGLFSFPTNGVSRGVFAPFTGLLYLTIHNEYNGNGQNRSSLSGYVKISGANGIVILETEEKKSIDQEIYYETEQTFEIINGLHQGNLQNQTSVLPASIELDFFNCFCQGNGAESYIIKDAFNKNSLNIDLRPSLARIEQFKAIRRFADLTHGEAYVEGSSINGLNVFNTATGNYRELDKQNGSIQKLLSRDNDIVVLKERKASKVMFKKDILYNTDGTSNVTGTNQILGPEVTYLGSNGVGKHPEGCAINDYQIYYPNPEQGVITRLSIDGTTPIVKGMTDFFKDIFRRQPNAKMLGGYDPHKKHYVFSVGDEPEKLLQLSCGNQILKENQIGVFRYELKLNDLSGNVVLNYNITSGNATIQAEFNGSTYVVSNVTGLGNLTFNRLSLVENIVVITVSQVGLIALSYEISNNCPVGSELKIVSIIVNDTLDIGKNIVSQFKWGSSSLYSSQDSFTIVPVSKFLTETGIEGVGKFPLNNSVFTIQSFKDSFTTGAFSLEECNRMGFLISDTVYTSANINTILTTATFLSISSLSEPGFSETRFGNFLFNRTNTNEMLYLIWDYTNRKPIALNDYTSTPKGSVKNIEVLTNDSDPNGLPLTVTIVTGPTSGTAVVQLNNTITYTHDNSNSVSDTITYVVSNGVCQSEPATIFIDIAIACDQTFTFNGGQGTFTFQISFGTEIGQCGIDYNAFTIPDKFELFYDGVLVGTTTGEVAGTGSLLFTKTTAFPTVATIVVTANQGGTAWNVSGVCPGT